ncbi:MAG: VIT1/CCC1 transporter family protein [Methanomassiliicoccales archaeon]
MGEVRQRILRAQRNEITEHHFYSSLAKRSKDEKNSETLAKIAGDELVHYRFLKGLTSVDVGPDRWKLFRYNLISRVFGITFAIKLMERGEEEAEEEYMEIAEYYPEASRISKEEDEHEHMLINMLDERRLNYAGAMVKGTNDGIIELTGEVAGLTFVFQNTSIIALIAFISSIAGTLSLGSSQYLAGNWERDCTPVWNAAYSVAAHLFTLLLLISPYLLIDDPHISLIAVLVLAVLLILVLNFYLSVAMDFSFKRRFIEMMAISLGIAAITFLIGFTIEHFLHLDL